MIPSREKPAHREAARISRVEMSRILSYQEHTMPLSASISPLSVLVSKVVTLSIARFLEYTLPVFAASASHLSSPIFYSGPPYVHVNPFINRKRQERVTTKGKTETSLQIVSRVSYRFDMMVVDHSNSRSK